MIITILGGVGLFLLGMVLMTEGLKAVAGSALRSFLERFVGGRLSAIGSGALATALVQSSSATTLTTIGFVSAGLLTFPQAVGVIFGSNLGTTSTGWLVSLIGFKLKITVLALPAVLVGAVLRLLGRDRIAALGLALAGFGVIFIGIDTLQTGMQGLAEKVNLTGLGDASVLHRLMLVGIGIAMTVVMQSSSAAVATTLTALHAGAINFEGAAALVIGQNVGTTVTAAIAAVGASVAARRTALAHILFNTTTAVVAFLLLPLFVSVSMWLASGADSDPGAVAVAAFHTMFNLLGVLIFTPALPRFAAAIERILPETGPLLTQRLDASVAGIPPVAVEAARLTLADSLRATAAQLLEVLRPVGPEKHTDPRALRELLERVEHALAEARNFMGLIRGVPETENEHIRHLSTLHALDHLERLVEAVRSVKISAVRGAQERDETLRSAVSMLVAELDRIAAPREGSDLESYAGDLQGTAETMGTLRRTHRDALLRVTARGDLDPVTADTLLDTMRLLDRLMYHLWRTVFHLERARATHAAGSASA